MLLTVLQIAQVQELRGVDHICLDWAQITQARNSELPAPKPAPIGRPAKATPLKLPTEDLIRTLPNTGDGKFLNYVSGACRSLVFSTQVPILLDMEESMGKLFARVKDDVVRYHVFSTRLASRDRGVDTFQSAAFAGLLNIVEDSGEVNKGYNQWKRSLTGRLIESDFKVYFQPTDEDENGEKLEKPHCRFYSEERSGFIHFSLLVAD